jgi:hypothetical protein
MKPVSQNVQLSNGACHQTVSAADFEYPSHLLAERAAG